jgi:dipeptidyl aminopeptidase/acylaminoacyl peptidase
MWDDPACPLSAAYMNDLRSIDNVLGCAPKIRVPWLLVHGAEDDVVPIQDSRDIYQKANDPKKLVELPGANHVFAGEFTAPMARVVVDWVKAATKS